MMIPTRITKIKKKSLSKLSVGWDVEQLELLYTADGSVNWSNHFGKLFLCLK